MDYKTPEVIKQYADQMAKVMSEDMGISLVKFEPVVIKDTVIFKSTFGNLLWLSLPVDALLNADTSFKEKFNELSLFNGPSFPS